MLKQLKLMILAVLCLGVGALLTACDTLELMRYDDV